MQANEDHQNPTAVSKDSPWYVFIPFYLIVYY